MIPLFYRYKNNSYLKEFKVTIENRGVIDAIEYIGLIRNQISSARQYQDLSRRVLKIFADYGVGDPASFGEKLDASLKFYATISVDESRRHCVLQKCGSINVSRDALAMIVNESKSQDIHHLKIFYELDNRSWKKQGERVLRRYVDMMVSDHVITEDEHERLNQVRIIFGISEKFMKRLFRDVGSNVVNSAAKTFAGDGEITSEETSQLYALANYLGVSDAKASSHLTKAAMEKYKSELASIIEDNRVSTDEIARIRGIAERLGIPESSVQKDLSQFSRLHLIWRFESGNLPSVPGPGVMLRGEVCHWATSARFVEIKKTSLGYSGGSQGLSVRIAKGVTYRVGGHRGKMQYKTEAIRHSGQLYLTSKRILFAGGSKAFEVKYFALMHYEVFSDGVTLHKNNRKDPIVIDVDDTDLLALAISAIVNNS